MKADGFDREFAKVLLAYQPIFDREIIKDITPVQGWIGHVDTGASLYHQTLETVRKLVEGITWRPTPFTDETDEQGKFCPDRIAKMFPDLNKEWP